MGVILDTTAVVGLLELGDDRQLLIEAVRAAGGTELPGVSVVTLGELAAGVQAAGDHEDRRAARQRTLGVVEGQHRRSRFDILPIDRSTWQRFGQVSGLLTRKIGHNDKWIAATALAAGRTLVTQDALLAENSRRISELQVLHVARRA